MELYKVILTELREQREMTLSVEVDEAETTENIEITAVIFGQRIASSHYYYFPAFQEFRDKLLLLGYGMKCNGSRINAVQSGMMGATDKVYLVEMGKPARREDMVPLFGYADIGYFPDTREQEDFFERWSRRRYV